MGKHNVERMGKYQMFLRSYFSSELNQVEEKHINGFVLFKHWDGNRKEWTVDLFTEESFKEMKNAGEKQKELFRVVDMRK